MKKSHIESVLAQYIRILKQGRQDNLAWLLEELMTNPQMLEQDTPTVLGEFQVEGRSITKEFVGALVLGILQTQERNTERNLSYDPSITAPLGYYSIEELSSNAGTSLTNALRHLEEYNDSGQGISTSTADEELFNNIKNEGYSDKTARLMALACSVGGMLELLGSD